MDIEKETIGKPTRRDKIGLALLLGGFLGLLAMLIGVELLRAWLGGH